MYFLCFVFLYVCVCCVLCILCMFWFTKLFVCDCVCVLYVFMFVVVVYVYTDLLCFFLYVSIVCMFGIAFYVSCLCCLWLSCLFSNSVYCSQNLRAVIELPVCIFCMFYVFCMLDCVYVLVCWMPVYELRCWKTLLCYVNVCCLFSCIILYVGVCFQCVYVWYVLDLPLLSVFCLCVCCVFILRIFFCMNHMFCMFWCFQ